MTQERSSNDDISLEVFSGENNPHGDLLIREFVKVATQSQLSRLSNWIDLINKTMGKFIEQNQGEPEILYQAANHLLIAGGKQFRSLLSVLACVAVGGDPKDIAPIALAEELLQTASLIHDDMIDNDDFRRGVDSVHKKYGEEVAIIAADLLIAQAIRLIGEYGTLELLANLGRGGIKMCEGETEDFLYVADESEQMSTAEYLLMIDSKTVAFMREAVRSGATFGKASREQMDKLVEYAENLGYAFQIRDDILDITSSTKDTGKSVLSDLKKRGINYLFIHALESVSEKRRKQCLEELSAGNLKDALSLIQETSAVEHAEDMAQMYVDRAKEVLENIQLNEKDLLEVLADYVITRER
ncbi:polyprenyl synthetase family protein [Candidatus Thorarchaeota archaeon]|nr:MAG: polyprenyl synthetase family protein [Candidatus Thorarchaeota archaeon]